jgi:hypothetical protein
MMIIAMAPITTAKTMTRTTNIYNALTVFLKVYVFYVHDMLLCFNHTL